MSKPRAQGRVVLVGNPALLVEAGVAVPPEKAATAQAGTGSSTPVHMAVDSRFVGIVHIADAVRPGAREALAALNASGVKRTVMFTGDTAATAHAVAQQLGIDEVHADLLPEDKVAVIAALQAQGHRVAMVGDGIKDASALARADATSAPAPGLNADADAKRFAPDPAALTVFVVRRKWGDGRNFVNVHSDGGAGVETLPNPSVRLKCVAEGRFVELEPKDSTPPSSAPSERRRWRWRWPWAGGLWVSEAKGPMLVIAIAAVWLCAGTLAALVAQITHRRWLALLLGLGLAAAGMALLLLALPHLAPADQEVIQRHRSGALCRLVWKATNTSRGTEWLHLEAC